MKISLWVCLLGLAMTLHGYDLRTKALTPIAFEKPSSHAPFKLVDNGELQFVIVTDKNVEKNPRTAKSIAPAVAVIQEAFEKCTGKKPEILDVSEAEKIKKYPAKLIVGDNAVTRANGIQVLTLPKQGFAIKSIPDGLIIAGYDSSLIEDYNADVLDKRGACLGTQYGAYDFVERFLGVRYFFPGEYGTHWPKIRDLTISPVHYTDYPRFDKRGTTYYFWLSFSTPQMLRKWEANMGKLKLKDSSFAARWRIGHANPLAGSHCPHPGILAQAYPDKLKTIFYTTPSGRFCYTAKQHTGNIFNVLDLAFADLLMEVYKAFYRSGGQRDVGVGDWCSNSAVSFGICDTYLRTVDVIGHPTVRNLNLITSADLRRGDDAAMANVYGRFYQYLGRRLEKELPGKKLYILAYYNSSFPSLDPRWRLPDNVEVNLCDFRLPIQVYNKKAMEKTVRLFREWYEALGNRPVQMVWLYNPRLDRMARAVAGEFVGEVPKILGKYLGREGQMYFDLDGVDDMWNHYYSMYAACRSQWNPDWDVEAGIDEHWSLFYGDEAGACLKEFHKILKRNVIQYYSTHDSQPGLYPPEELNRMETLLKQAEKALRPGSVEMHRFKLLAEPWPGIFESQRVRLSYERPVYLVHRLLPNEQITVNGKPSEGVWERIASIPLFDPRGSQSPLKFPVDVKLAYDENGIYGLMRTSGKPKCIQQQSLWNNDNFELFFSPGVQRQTLYQIAFDAIGQQYSSFQRLLPIPQPVDLEWKPAGFKLENQVPESSWTVEFFLPFAALGVDPSPPYSCWYFNVVRNRRSEPQEYSGSSLTLGINNNLNQFGLLKFAGKGD